MTDDWIGYLLGQDARGYILLGMVRTGPSWQAVPICCAGVMMLMAKGKEKAEKNKDKNNKTSAREGVKLVNLSAPEIAKPLQGKKKF